MSCLTAERVKDRSFIGQDLPVCDMTAQCVTGQSSVCVCVLDSSVCERHVSMEQDSSVWDRTAQCVNDMSVWNRTAQYVSDISVWDRTAQYGA